MTVLGIHTAGLTSHIALISNKKVLAEKSWQSTQDESEKVLPEIIAMLKDNGKSFKDLTKIVVITGPGPFTAVRVSVAIANALAYGLNIPVIGIPLMDLWKARVKEEAEIVFQAGKSRVFYKNEVISNEDFIAQIDDNTKLTGELRDEVISHIQQNWINQETLPTFADTLTELLQNKLEESSQVMPMYYADPNITKSNKAYK